MPKTYRATFILGQTSDTDDVEAELVPTAGAIEPPRDEVQETIRQFVGDIEQRPPAHSAIKIGGKRAYQLALRGVDFEIKPRPVTIYSIDIQRYAFPELELDVVCGKGTYIRSLGRDLGAVLGTGAVMSALERTAIGKFEVANSVEFEKLTPATVGDFIQPAIAAIGHLPRATLSAGQVLELQNGRPVLAKWLGATTLNDPDAEIAGLDDSGQLVSILYEKRPGELWPRLNFREG